MCIRNSLSLQVRNAIRNRTLSIIFYLFVWFWFSLFSFTVWSDQCWYLLDFSQAVCDKTSHCWHSYFMIQPHASELPGSCLSEGLKLYFLLIKLCHCGLKQSFFFFSSNLMGCCHSNTSIFHVRKKALYTQHKEETRLSHNHAQHHCQAILVEKTKKTLAYQPPLTVLCISSAKLLRVCSVPSSRSLTKMLNSSSYRKELVERCNSENTCHFSNCDLIFMIYWWVLSKCTGFKIVPS